MLLIDLDDSAKRQFIDARTLFVEIEKTRKQAKEIRGGMLWKTVNGGEYLVRTSPSGSQKSLGLRAAATELSFTKFKAKKKALTDRLADLEHEMRKHERLNKATFAGRTPNLVIEILARIEKADLSAHFLVVGTHALYAYEQAASVRIADDGAMATRDVDLLWDTRKRIQFATTMKLLKSSMLGILKKVDNTFVIRGDQPYTAINSKGFEVDIIRREAKDGDPHPLKMTEHNDDFWVVEARRANDLLTAERFTTPVVGANGQMARMNTISPAAFVEFKRWMSNLDDRELDKRSRDARQADIVQGIIDSQVVLGRSARR